ncbi:MULTISPECIES: flagellar biosynthetic protein FliO [Chromobacterium]|uniref:flagellar biosynthetic protein FliO n=1 Tax=Chromobacterium TaxID=535 RepID=UPI001E4ECC49|nr:MULTISPECIES: flagellar biosynthetic protein FliO [Chromobacterium]WON86052.1 flagellar biosynthetic protein FliO [Chromobacterium haemolyticum]
MFAMTRRAVQGAFYLAASGLAAAATATAAPSPAAAPSPFMSLLQVLFGLAVVLGAIVGMAWLFKRLSGGMLGASNRLKVVSGTLVGPKERVVIVELEGEWLVLGVTPQQVNLLSKLPRPEGAEIEAAPAAEPFARWLKAAMDKSRNSKAGPR